MRKTRKDNDPIRPWYEAIGSLGDYEMIRFGRVKPGASEVEWVSIPHSEFDGIGGFAHLLRKCGIDPGELPTMPHPAPPSWRPFFRSLPKFLQPRRRLRWKTFPERLNGVVEPLPDPVLAWHVFSEEETQTIRAAARTQGVTVNTFLMKHLDKVLRRDLEQAEAAIPWMIPVNLRGKIEREDDTQNHSSYVSVKVKPEESMKALHESIYEKLDRGEHWASWMGYSATTLLPKAMKRALIKSDRAMTEWHLGLFTNLGVWDPKKEITHESFAGSWLVAATVLRCQLVGAGLMTFQGRLSLTVQVHPELTTEQEVPDRWMREWLSAVEEGL